MFIYIYNMIYGEREPYLVVENKDQGKQTKITFVWS